MIAKIALLLGKKKDGSWTVINQSAKPAALMAQMNEATSDGYVVAGIARNIRLARSRRATGEQSLEEDIEKRTKSLAEKKGKPAEAKEAKEPKAKAKGKGKAKTKTLKEKEDPKETDPKEPDETEKDSEGENEE